MQDRLAYSVLGRAADMEAWADDINRRRHSDDPNAALGLGLRTVDAAHFLDCSADGTPARTHLQESLVIDADMAARFEAICDAHGVHYIRTDQWTGPTRDHTPEHVEIDGEQVRATLATHRRHQSQKRVKDSP